MGRRGPTGAHNGALRVLPISEFALCVLLPLRGGVRPTIKYSPQWMPRGYPSTPSECLLASGIPDANLRTLRHTAASWLVMGKVDL